MSRKGEKEVKDRKGIKSSYKGKEEEKSDEDIGKDTKRKGRKGKEEVEKKVRNKEVGQEGM